MPNIVSAGNLLPLVGTPAFLPSMLSYIRNASSGTLPLDPIIFQAILLCIIAGDKHLLLHTQEEDVGIVVRLAAWILSSIFDLTTHKLRIKPQLEVASHFTSPASATDRSPFLRSLFLRSDRDEPSQTSGKSRTSNSRNDQSPSRSKKFRPMQYARSASFPSETSFSVTSASQSLDKYSANQQSQSIVPPRPRTAEQRSPATMMQRSPVFPAHSIRHRETRPVFPQALVVSGLEHASVLDQRAFARVLAEKRVVLEERTFHESSSLKSSKLTRGRESLDSKSDAFDAERLEDDDCGVWNTPEGFIAIYVCPWNPRERPNIHKTLLDKFAISTTIVVLNSVRHAMRTPPLSSVHSILHPHVYSQSHLNPPTPSPSQALLLPQSQTPPPVTRSHAHHHHHSYRYSHSNAPPLVAKHLPSDFLHALRTTCQQTYIAPALSMYLADLFSAARHHPQLDGTFLTVRAMEDAEDLARASRVLGVDPTGSELVRNADNVLYPYVDYDDDESVQGRYDTDELGSGSVIVNNAIDGTYADPDSGIQNQPELSATGAEGQQVNPEPLYVSEADIARIVPRVVTHRLRVRSGPQDEVLSSAVFGATFGDHIDNGRDGGCTYDSQGARSTVKDILVGILSDV